MNRFGLNVMASTLKVRFYTHVSSRLHWLEWPLNAHQWPYALLQTRDRMQDKNLVLLPKRTS